MIVKMQGHIGIQTQKVQTVEFGEYSVPETPGNSLLRPDVRGSAPHVLAKEYAELKRLIKQKGLLGKQPAYYTYKILLTVSLLAVGLVFLLVVNNFWLQILN